MKHIFIKAFSLVILLVIYSNISFAQTNKNHTYIITVETAQQGEDFQEQEAAMKDLFYLGDVVYHSENNSYTAKTTKLYSLVELRHGIEKRGIKIIGNIIINNPQNPASK